MQTLQLDTPIIYINGKASRHEDGTPLTLGDLLALAAGNHSVEAADVHWPARMGTKLAAGGTAELDPGEVAKLADAVRNSRALAPWAKGPLLYLLGMRVDDAEALALYRAQYGERPHEAAAGNGTGEAPAPN